MKHCIRRGIAAAWPRYFSRIIKHQDRGENDTPYHFYGYNVWGFKDET
jgi:hypothetical protein